jgi:lipopolysaccharide export system permease protein
VLAHVLLPRAAAQLALREADIARNATARLFRDGQFMTPSQGVAIYIREVTPGGELVDLFLSDRRDPATDLTYTAARAYVVRTAAGPQLVMRDGMVQALDRPSGRLAVTTFADLAFDASALADATARTGRTARELSTAELLFPTPALAAETGLTEGELVVQGHYRFSDGLLAMVGAVVGFATLLVGGFSRFGVWRQILAALGVMIGVKLVEAVMVALVREMPALWAVLYVPAGLGMATAAGLLWAAGRPGLLLRRRARAVAA